MTHEDVMRIKRLAMREVETLKVSSNSKRITDLKLKTKLAEWNWHVVSWSKQLVKISLHDNPRITMNQIILWSEGCSIHVFYFLVLSTIGLEGDFPVTMLFLPLCKLCTTCFSSLCTHPRICDDFSSSYAYFSLIFIINSWTAEVMSSIHWESNKAVKSQLMETTSDLK